MTPFEELDELIEKVLGGSSDKDAEKGRSDAREAMIIIAAKRKSTNHEDYFNDKWWVGFVCSVLGYCAASIGVVKCVEIIAANADAVADAYNTKDKTIQ